MTTPSPYLIRDGIAADIERYQRIDTSYETDTVWQVSVQHDTDAHSITFRPTRLPRSMTGVHSVKPALLSHALPPEQCFLVAANRHQPSEVWGYLVMLTDPTQPAAMLRSIAVHPERRRRGIARRLLATAAQWAAGHGLGRIVAETPTKNYPAIALYQQAGYVFCGFNDQYFTNQDIAVFFCQSLR
jgi:ribosomal protein S18 acetylase RimI-like enzyme